MKLSFGFGTGTQEVSVPEQNLIGVLHANDVSVSCTGEAEVRRALTAPIGSPRLREIVKPGETVAIITSDITRPMPTLDAWPIWGSRPGVTPPHLGCADDQCFASVRNSARLCLRPAWMV